MLSANGGAREALGCFPIGEPEALRPVHSGLVHQTWIVHTSLDGRPSRFVLQRLHPRLATPEIADDYRAVTEHLQSRGACAPRLVQTAGGDPLARAGGHVWRLTSFVTGTFRARVSGVAEAEAGARALGRFHRQMEGLGHVFRSSHPLHDTPAHLAAFRCALQAATEAERALIAAESRELLSCLPGCLLPFERLPRRVVHGDPKISNVVFRGDEAVGLIDLDTCSRHSVLVDLGDAARSWCRDGDEDQPQAFHLSRFEAILRGYRAEGPELAPVEVDHLAAAGRVITLELACRFLRDVLEDDYFGWDRDRYPDRRSHNLARARAMLFLARDMAAQEPAARALVAEHFGPIPTTGGC